MPDSLRLGRLAFAVITFGIGLYGFTLEPLRAASPWPTPKTIETTPPLQSITLPGTELPTSATPIEVHAAETAYPVHAGDTVSTPCFSTTVPLDGVAEIKDCALVLSPAEPGQGPDDPYVTILLIPSEQSSLENLRASVLAQIKADGVHLGRTGYRDDVGPYLGSRKAAIFGVPAVQMGWGFIQSGPGITTVTTRVAADGTRKREVSQVAETEELRIFSLLPSGHYRVNGKDLTTLDITGYSIGYVSKAFAYAVAHLHML